MSPPAFEFATAGRIIFGDGARREAAGAAAALGRRALVVTGATPSRAAWLLDALRRAGVATKAFRTPGEPTLETARAAVAAARAHGADLVVGVGGGAAIDTAKAAAGLAPQTGDALDHLEVVGRGLPLAAPALPVVAIPTTAGTGAEVTRNAVLGVPEHARKVSLRDHGLLPRVAVVDPELTHRCPGAVTLESGLDALVQVIEPYLSVRATPYTDALCRDAIPRALAALPRVVAEADHEDREARAEMALVSLTGGIALANAGLGAVHGLAGPLGGVTGGRHGAICGRLLAPVLRATRAALDARAPAARRLAEVEEAIGRVFGVSGGDPLDALERWADEAGLPRLGALGLAEGDHAVVARASAASSSMKGAPVALSEAVLLGILTEAG